MRVELADYRQNSLTVNNIFTDDIKFQRSWIIVKTILEWV